MKDIKKIFKFQKENEVIKYKIIRDFKKETFLNQKIILQSSKGR